MEVFKFVRQKNRTKFWPDDIRRIFCLTEFLPDEIYYNLEYQTYSLCRSDNVEVTGLDIVCYF